MFVTGMIKRFPQVKIVIYDVYSINARQNYAYVL